MEKQRKSACKKEVKGHIFKFFLLCKHKNDEVLDLSLIFHNIYPFEDYQPVILQNVSSLDLCDVSSLDSAYLNLPAVLQKEV